MAFERCYVKKKKRTFASHFVIVQRLSDELRLGCQTGTWNTHVGEGRKKSVGAAKLSSCVIGDETSAVAFDQLHADTNVCRLLNYHY